MGGFFGGGAGFIGSGAGIPLAFAADFTAGSIGDALEQKITTGRVNLGRSLLGGAENAISQMLYGTGKLTSAKNAFLRGAGAGAISSGLRNIEDAIWPENMLIGGSVVLAVQGSMGLGKLRRRFVRVSLGVGLCHSYN